MTDQFWPHINYSILLANQFIEDNDFIEYNENIVSIGAIYG